MKHEFPTRRLGEVCEIIMGQSPPGSTYNECGDGLPFFQGVADFGARYPTQRVWCTLPSRIAEPGDVLLSIRAPIGRVNLASYRCAVGRGLAILRAKAREDQTFIEFALRSARTKWDAMEGGGTVFANATRSQLETLEVPWPNAGFRRAIARVLGSLDDKIELNRRMNQTLEEICRALFKFWFVDFGPVRAKAEGRWKKGESLPGMPADMWDLWPSEFEESEIGEIPEGWGVDGLGKVASCRRDLIDPSEIDPEEKYVGLEHITPRSLSLWHWGRVGDTVSGKARFKRGEILFGKLRPYFHKVCVPWFDGVASTDILTIAPKSSDWFGFALGHFSSAALVDYATAASNGTKMPRTSWEDLARWQVALPPVELARTLTTVFLPLVSKMGKAIEESTLLGETRDTLLPKLLSGEIRVSQVEAP